MRAVHRRLIGEALVSTLMSTSSLYGQIVDVETPRSNIEVGRLVIDVNVNVDVDVDVNADDRLRDDGQGQNRQGDGLQGHGGQALSTDQEIAQWLLVNQRATIDFAGYGMERTQSPEVRQLAEMVVQDHQRLHDDLMRVTGSAAVRANGTRRPIENIIDRIEDRVERVADRTERVLDRNAPLVGETRDGAIAADRWPGPSTRTAYFSVRLSIPSIGG